MRIRFTTVVLLALILSVPLAVVAAAQPAAPAGVCAVKAANFHGWKAEQMSNQWTTLTIVPQLGARFR